MKRNVKSILKRNLPTILNVLGVVGAGAVGVSAAVAQHKVDSDTLDYYEHNMANMRRKDLVKIYAKHYWPTALIFGATGACIIGSNKMSQKQYKELLGAYTALGAGFAGYRGAVIEKYGEETDEELCETASRAIMTDPSCVDLMQLDTPDEKLLYYEPISKTYFRAYERDLILAEYHLNRNFLLKGEVNVSELLYFLGIEPTEETDKYGWSLSCGLCWIDIYHWQQKKPGREPYYEIVYMFEPEENYVNVDNDPEYQEISYVGNC